MRNTTQCPIAVMMADQHIRSQAPSTGQDYTPPPLKRHEREANPSPEEQPAESDTPATPETQSTLHTPPPTVCNSRWNPEHPNLFAALEKQLDFDNPALAEDNPMYNMVTVETAPESPSNQNNATNSIELDLEIHNGFPTSNNVPKDATSAEDKVIGDIPQLNNVYEGETTGVYANIPIETSSLIKEESVVNPPIENSPLI
ncbi:hypothetical protein DSO57_1004505 [Entomophthora muscae]|uniref:Uncharacterized protein n=1 Tax=Entomophthora muscae TaxID=34485 RepID=A0ACC2UTH3_9FUNG|nr:hypothetical protein DSO57_1004505 [Entomophthora muscae]